MWNVWVPRSKRCAQVRCFELMMLHSVQLAAQVGLEVEAEEAIMDANAESACLYSMDRVRKR